MRRINKYLENATIPMAMVIIIKVSRYAVPINHVIALEMTISYIFHGCTQVNRIMLFMFSS